MSEAALPQPAPAPPPAVGPAPAPVARPGLDPATRRQTVIVAAIIAGLFFGSQILNEALPGGVDQVEPGRPLEIAGPASITPLAGWEASRFEDGPGLRLEKGSIVLDLLPQTSETAADLAAIYRDQVLKDQSTELTSSDVATVPFEGGSGARFTYQGLFTGAEGALEGEVSAFVSGGQGVVADAWSRQGRLDDLLGEVHDMLESIVVAP